MFVVFYYTGNIKKIFAFRKMNLQEQMYTNKSIKERQYPIPFHTLVMLYLDAARAQ